MRKSLEELSSKKNKSDAEYDNIDKLEEDIQTAEQKLADMYDIDVYAKETNHLSISLEGIGPAQQTVLWHTCAEDCCKGTRLQMQRYVGRGRKTFLCQKVR